MVMVIDAIKLTLFPAMMAFAAASDLLTMTIANRVSFILLGGFAFLAALTGLGPVEIFWHAAAAVAVLAVVFVFFTCGWIGGGDAKLAAVTVLWLGFAHLLDYLLYASLLGGALTLVLLRFRALPLPRALVGRAWAERLHRSDGGVPYGIALAAAALAVYPHTQWIASAAGP